MKYYRNLYRNDIRDYMMALELDDGTLVECYNEEDVNKCCKNTDASSNITVNGITFKKNQVKSVYFGNWNLNSIPDYFCYYFSNLTHIDPLPDMITSIGNNFMHVCTSFNQPLTLPSSLISISHSFMANCTSFNSLLTLPSSITSIDNYFMCNCNNFISPLEILFTDPNVFVSNNYSFSTNSKSVPMYTTGVTITGNMTGTQLKTRLPNIYGTSGYYRKILD